jgi:head-tail adaptor
MNKRITVFIQKQVPDEYGGYTSAWVEFADIWAKVDFVSEDKKDVKRKQQIKAVYAFVTRNDREFSMPLRVRYMDKYFITRKLEFFDDQQKYISIISEMEES